MTDKKDWRSLFVGRETELAWLQDAWHKARSGRPQLCVLRGESGLGKTKIAQELYAWLSRPDIADPDGYWPAHLIAGDNLRLNPDLATQPLGEDMHYLWWGLRWLPPDARNQGELTHCAFYDQRQMLRPHWQHLSLFKDTAAATLKLGGEIGNIALELARDTAISIFPLLGIFKSVTDVGGAVRDVGQAAKEFGAEFARHSKSPAEREAEELAEQINQIVAFLGWVLKPFHRSGSGSMPVVLVLDDAQWIDPRSLEVVRRLFDLATGSKWPLLVVATHWEREWHEGLAAGEAPADAESVPGRLRHFADYYQAVAAKEDGACKLLDLTRLRGEATVLQAAFPGLTPEQSRTLTAHADGNPRLLTEMILYLESEPSLFESEDLNGPLDDAAIEELEMDMSGFEINRLQERRYRRLPAEIREVLALASLQGVRFLADLVNELARRVGLRAPSQCAASLGRAEYPHAIISSSGLEREFRFVIFHQFARRFLDRLCRRHKLEASEVRDTLIRIGTARLTSEYYARLTDSERESLLLMLLESGDHGAPGYVRALLCAINHYRTTGNFQRMGELLFQWQEMAGDRVIAFNFRHTELVVEYTPFYSGWVVFVFADYDVFPASPIRYATDGKDYRLLDGSAECIRELNQHANVSVNEMTALDYLRFYFASVSFDAGSSELIESTEATAFVNAEREARDAVATHYRRPHVDWNAEDNEGRVSALLAQRGSLYDVDLKIDAKGGVDFAAQVCLTDSLPRYENHYWGIEELERKGPGGGVWTGVLDGAVRPAMTMARGSAMLTEALRMLALTEQGDELLAPWIAGEVRVRIFDAAHDMARQPRDSQILYVGMPRYRPLTQQRVTLLVTSVLLEEILTREGIFAPELSMTRDDYVAQMSNRAAKRIARLCMFAYVLSLQDELVEYDFIAEMHAMGHGLAMDAFVQSL